MPSRDRPRLQEGGPEQGSGGCVRFEFRPSPVGSRSNWWWEDGDLYVSYLLVSAGTGCWIFFSLVPRAIEAGQARHEARWKHTDFTLARELPHARCVRPLVCTPFSHRRMAVLGADSRALSLGALRRRLFYMVLVAQQVLRRAPYMSLC